MILGLDFIALLALAAPRYGADTRPDVTVRRSERTWVRPD